MAKELREFVEVSKPAAILHQLTSTRTIRAVIVYVLLIVVTALIILDRPIPDILSSVFLLVIGTYFEEFTRASRSEVNSQAREESEYLLK